uniref:G_PROTEIN_RECEP_F1_2 domain-containing protein n=1 Tax=Parastrongyloides trichosuri TaxID=131310 RepID=A0A0N4ZJ47_PARTI
MNSAQFFVVIPLTYAGMDSLTDYSSSSFYKIFMELDSIGYNCSIFLTLLLTVDRLIKVFQDNHNDIERRRVYIFTLISWIYGITIMVLNNIFGVIKSYDRKSFCFVVDTVNPLPNTESFLIYTQTLSRLTPVIMLLAYIACFVKLKFSKLSSSIDGNNKDMIRTKISSSTMVERILVGTLYLILNITSVAINISAIITFVQKNEYFKDKPFFIYNHNLIIANFLMSIAQIFAIIPLTYANLTQLVEYENSIFYVIFMECDTLGYNCSIFLILSFTLDRLITFVGCKSIQVYEKTRIIIMVIISWIYGLFMLISTLFYGIYKRYDRSNYTLIVVTTRITSFSRGLVEYEEMASKVLPVFLFISCIICFIKARMMNKFNSRVLSTKWKFEKRILFQGIAFVMFYEVEALLFYQRQLALHLFGEKNIRFYFIVTNCAVICFTCFNSITLYIFNEVSRNHLFKFLENRNVSTVISIVTIPH